MTNGETDRLGLDRELLALARSILADEQYSVEEVAGDRLSLLLAENAYFIVAVTALPTISQILAAESIAEEMISERLASADPGPKQWDTYLILLTQERSPESSDVTRALFNINYDTSSLRRIAHSGVDATLASVRNSLTPFVAPIELHDPTITRDAFAFLVEALASRGIDRDLASRATSAFRQGVQLRDVL